MFGQQIPLTFNGVEKYQSLIGTFFTICCGTLLLGFGIASFTRMVSGEIMNSHSEEVFQDLLGDTPFNPITLD